jgi:chloride channel protein, CIC family
VSLFISSRLQQQPIYDALAVQDGIHLPKPETRLRQGQRQIIAVIRTLTESLPAELSVHEAWQQTRSSEFRSFLVVDSSGVVGVINRLRLERELTQDSNQQLGKIVSAVDFPHVHSDQSLDLALERMGANQLDVLPVVNRANIHKLEGIVTMRDVLDSYGISPSDGA